MPRRHTPKHVMLFKQGLEVLKEFEKAYLAARLADNALNRAKTAAKRFFISFLSEEKLPTDTTIVVENVAYCYGCSESQEVPPEKWYDMWQKGEISKDQYFDAIKVQKEAATRHIGEDQVRLLETLRKGTTADVRRDGKTHQGEKGPVIVVEEPESAPPPLKPVASKVPYAGAVLKKPVTRRLNLGKR